MSPRALVTGASVGIGNAFARELARRGHELVVVARNAEQLAALAAQVEAEHGVACEVLPADLTDPDQLARVEQRVADPDRPITTLVNNAGFGSYGVFHELDVAGEAGMIELNVVALVRLTHAALGPMVQRGSGAVLNVSSMASFQPSPRIATYAATKAFVTSFTQAVHEEVRGTGVRVSAVCPGFTRTEFQVRSGATGEGMPDFVWQSADEVARGALDALDRNRAVWIPGALNTAMGWIADALPGVVTRKTVDAMARRFKQ